MKSERIVLGSGKLYAMEFTSDMRDNLPENTAIEVDDNLLGYIQGGAELEYAPEYYEAKDDLGYVSKVILTEEEATLKSGIMTWNGTTLDKLSDTARVVSDTGGKRVVKIGGASNQKGKNYLLHFHHEDKADGDIRVNIVGRNQAGFTIAFAKDQETVIDAEFKAQPMDGEGTLILYEEEIKDTATQTYPLTITASAGGNVTTGASGSYAANAAISLSAEAEGGYVFDGWESSNGGTFANASAPSTTFTMPANATTVTATFVSE